MAFSESVCEAIDARYRVDAVLGRGGMATVYRVWDTRAERTCALKRLIASPGDRRTALLTALFQREYGTLEQLAHPSVIRVYDFAAGGDAPYYTMELLEGGDLRRAAPLPWRSACRLLREVASALALLHSRRLIHRDVTAANVHCAQDGHATLMDFGAMTDMGAASQLVGTPPYVAPEALHGQVLDGRVDLFALGALAYFALTGRDAYPAASTAQLPGQWRVAPAPPSAIAREVPEALDQLVMSLLSLDARGRPSGAAEVIERLTAIADLGRDSRLETARAYLTTPPLIGRERELQVLRQKLSRAANGEGAAVLIEGESGIGKSRVLDAYALEARMSGALLLRAPAGLGRGDDFALLRALSCALLEASPELAVRTARPHAGVLGHVLPELHDALGRPELVALSGEKQLYARVQAAADAWLRAAGQEQWLAIAVDDAHEADAPSLLTLVELARAAPSQRVALALALRTRGEMRAGKVIERLREACLRIELSPLDAVQGEALVRSLFGEVNNSKLVSGWAYPVARGNPRAIMDLAQHLVDTGHARYENGSWVLAADPSEPGLPRSLTDAHRARVQALGERARALAEGLSLVEPYGPLDIADYPALVPEAVPLRVYSALDELCARQILIASGSGHAFAHPALAATVAAGVGDARARELLHALAAIEQRRDKPLLAAHYLQRADDDAAALAVVETYAAAAIDQQANNRAFLLTPTGAAVIERALRVAERACLPPHRLYRLRRALLLVAPYCDLPLAPLAQPLLAQLRSDAGLDFYDPADADPGQFVERCLRRAQERYDRRAEHQRGLPPFEAIRELAHVVVILTGAYGRVIDAAGIAQLQSLLAPLRALAPAIELLHDITAAAVDRVHGRRLSERVDAILRRLAEPVPGLDETTRAGARRSLTYYLALEQAQLCSPHVLGYADYLAEDPVHEPLAWHLRMVWHLYGGDAQQARACRERTELLALRHAEGVAQLSTSVLYETEAHRMCGDLMALKAVLPRLEAQAGCGDGWRAFLGAVRGEYHMLRGRSELACEEFERVLRVAVPGAHTAFSRTIASYVEALLRMGEYDRAIEHARGACEQSAAHRLNPLYAVLLRASMAQALGERGDDAAAREQIQLAKSEAAELGMGGVPLGCVHEAAARIAIAARDRPAFELEAEHTRLQYARGGNPQLAGKYHRLQADARSAWSGSSKRPSRAP